MREGTDNRANLTVGDSEQDQSDPSDHSSLAAEASIHEEPGAGKSHAGICAGLSGNWQSYRDQLL